MNYVYSLCNSFWVALPSMGVTPCRPRTAGRIDCSQGRRRAPWLLIRSLAICAHPQAFPYIHQVIVYRQHLGFLDLER